MTLKEQLNSLIDTYLCQNCDWRGVQSRAEQPPFNVDIPDVQERVSSGEIHPAGTCPACGALVHGLLDDVLVIDAETGKFYSLLGATCLAYTGLTGPDGLLALVSKPLTELSPEMLGQLVQRYRAYLAGEQPS